MIPKIRAYHEAGHFVAALAQDVLSDDLNTVSVWAKAGRGATGEVMGRVVTGFDFAPKRAGERAAFVAFALAGPVAERRVRHGSLAGVLLVGGSGDWEACHEMIEPAHEWARDQAPDMFKRLVGEELQEGEAEARRLVTAHWPAIVRVAEALIASGGHLSGYAAVEAAAFEAASPVAS